MRGDTEYAVSCGAEHVFWSLFFPASTCTCELGMIKISLPDGKIREPGLRASSRKDKDLAGFAVWIKATYVVRQLTLYSNKLTKDQGVLELCPVTDAATQLRIISPQHTLRSRKLLCRNIWLGAAWHAGWRQAQSYRAPGLRLSGMESLPSKAAQP